MMFDTSVMVDFTRGDMAAAKVITDEPERQVPMPVWLELLQGVRNKRELAELLSLFRDFGIEVVPLTESIGARAAKLLEKHVLGDGLEALDALIAATALERDCELLTWNRKHFRSVGGLKLRG